MQYTLHLQFSNPKGDCLKTMSNKKTGISSCNVKDKVCEKCNYVHLVHCPMNDSHCNTEGPKTKYMNKNRSHSKSSLHNHYEDVLCDKKHSNKNEEIKIEGTHNILPRSVKVIVNEHSVNYR